MNPEKDKEFENNMNQLVKLLKKLLRNLPGQPDLVFNRLKKIIFVHGCFWHRHAGCSLARLPKSRLEFWWPKLDGNKRRDRRNARALAIAGWKVLTIWECQIGDKERVQTTVRRFLGA